MEVVKRLKDVNEMSEQELRAEVIRLRSLLEVKDDTPQPSESIKNEVRSVDLSLTDSMNLSHLNEIQKHILNKILQKDPKAVESVSEEFLVLKTSNGKFKIPFVDKQNQLLSHMKLTWDAMVEKTKIDMELMDDNRTPLRDHKYSTKEMINKYYQENKLKKPSVLWFDSIVGLMPLDEKSIHEKISKSTMIQPWDKEKVYVRWSESQRTVNLLTLLWANESDLTWLLTTDINNIGFAEYQVMDGLSWRMCFWVGDWDNLMLTEFNRSHGELSANNRSTRRDDYGYHTCLIEQL